MVSSLFTVLVNLYIGTVMKIKNSDQLCRGLGPEGTSLFSTPYIGSISIGGGGGNRIPRCRRSFILWNRMHQEREELLWGKEPQEWLWWWFLEDVSSEAESGTPVEVDMTQKRRSRVKIRRPRLEKMVVEEKGFFMVERERERVGKGDNDCWRDGLERNEKRKGRRV